MKKDKCPLCGELDNKHMKQCKAKDLHKSNYDRTKKRKLEKEHLIDKLKKSKRKINK